jgi:hypothetical protein
MRNTLDEREQDKFVESIARPGKSMVEVTGVVTATIDKSGLATDVKQDVGNASLNSIDTKLSSQATAANQVTTNSHLSTIITALSAIYSAITGVLNIRSLIFATDKVDVTGSTVTSNIGTTGGLSLEATQLLVKAKTDNLDVLLSTRATEQTLAAVLTELLLKAKLTDRQPVQTKAPLTANAPTVVSVGTATSTVVSANANRKGLVLINTSNKVISFGIGQAAVSGSGITLQPNGVWQMDEYTFSTAAINGIATGAASALAVQEFQ